MREHQDDGERAVKKEADGGVGQMQILQKTVENAVATQNRLPGIAADQVADPERHDNQLIKKFFASARVE